MRYWESRLNKSILHIFIEFLHAGSYATSEKTKISQEKTLPEGVKKNVLCRKLNPWCINKISQCSKESDAIWGVGSRNPFRLFFCFFLLLWPWRMPCGISVPWPGVISTPPALEAQGVSHWTAREVSEIPFLYVCLRFTRLSLTPDPLAVRFTLKGASQVALVAKTHLPTQETQEMQVWAPGREDPLDWEMATTPVFLLGNPMDRGPWQASVHGVAKSWTRLSKKNQKL